MKIILVALCLFTSVLARAEEISATQTSSAVASRFDWANVLTRLKASYGFLALGPTMQNVDGNIDGKGRYFAIRNYLNLDYTLTDNWEMEAAGEMRQYWRAPDPTKPNRQDIEARDPFLGFARKNIFRGNYFSMSAKARYAFPVTNYNKSKLGTVEDAGNGELDFGLNPGWRFFDGALSLSVAMDLYYKFDKIAAADRENYVFKARPQASYAINRKVSAKVEYNSGSFRHANSGHWSKANDRYTGQKVYAGVVYSPVEAVSLNPSLGWGSHTFKLNNAEVSLFGSYSFL